MIVTQRLFFDPIPFLLYAIDIESEPASKKYNNFLLRDVRQLTSFSSSEMSISKGLQLPLSV